MAYLDDDEKANVIINDTWNGDEKQVVRISTHIMRGNPNTNIINESGLYSLILRSRKPEAKAFKKSG